MTMDRVRPAGGATRRVWLVAAVALLLASAVVVTASLRTPAAVVQRDRIVIDTVKRGQFVRQIAAPGALVPEQVRLLAAPAAGRVEAIHVKAGDEVRSGDPVVTLVNRDATKELLEIEQQVAVAEADLADMMATLEARSLDSEKVLRRTDFERRDAARQAEAATQLAREGLTPELEAMRAREAAEEIAGRVETEHDRHAALQRSAAAQLDAQRNRIERLRALHRFQRTIVDGLIVRTPAAGVVREITVQDGEWLTEGFRIARLVEPGRLKAVLQVPEATALDVRQGQAVTMNARGTRLEGIVERVGATVEQGAVAVEARLTGELPGSLRPDLSVDARIELSSEADALTVARPANAAAHGTAHLYRVDASGRTARRIEVRFGTASIDRIVIVAGASPADRLIISGTEDREEDVIGIE